MNRRVLIRDLATSIAMQLDACQGGALTIGDIFGDIVAALGAIADELDEHQQTLEEQSRALFEIDRKPMIASEGGAT